MLTSASILDMCVSCCILVFVECIFSTCVVFPAHLVPIRRAIYVISPQKDVIEMGMPLCSAGLYNRQLITEDAISIFTDGRVSCIN